LLNSRTILSADATSTLKPETRFIYNSLTRRHRSKRSR